MELADVQAAWEAQVREGCDDPQAVLRIAGEIAWLQEVARALRTRIAAIAQERNDE